MQTYKKKVILGVAESDAHVVANHLIAYHLRSKGYEVVNLGACTPVSEFVDALERNSDVQALIIGTLNGHALRDLQDLRVAKDQGKIRCPVIIGGNLSVGSKKSPEHLDKIHEIGVDYVLNGHEEIFPLLEKLAQGSAKDRRVS